MQMLRNPGSSGDNKISPEGTAEQEQVVSITRLRCAEAVMAWESAAALCTSLAIVPVRAQAPQYDKSQ